MNDRNGRSSEGSEAQINRSTLLLLMFWRFLFANILALGNSPGTLRPMHCTHVYFPVVHHDAMTALCSKLGVHDDVVRPTYDAAHRQHTPIQNNSFVCLWVAWYADQMLTVMNARKYCNQKWYLVYIHFVEFNKFSKLVKILDLTRFFNRSNVDGMQKNKYMFAKKLKNVIIFKMDVHNFS